MGPSGSDSSKYREPQHLRTILIMTVDDVSNLPPFQPSVTGTDEKKPWNQAHLSGQRHGSYYTSQGVRTIVLDKFGAKLRHTFKSLVDVRTHAPHLRYLKTTPDGIPFAIDWSSNRPLVSIKLETEEDLFSALSRKPTEMEEWGIAASYVFRCPAQRDMEASRHSFSQLLCVASLTCHAVAGQRYHVVDPKPGETVHDADTDRLIELIKWRKLQNQPPLDHIEVRASNSTPTACANFLRTLSTKCPDDLPESITFISVGLGTMGTLHEMASANFWSEGPIKRVTVPSDLSMFRSSRNDDKTFISPQVEEINFRVHSGPHYFPTSGKVQSKLATYFDTNNVSVNLMRDGKSARVTE